MADTIECEIWYKIPYIVMMYVQNYTIQHM
jgi:hypothetical protein